MTCEKCGRSTALKYCPWCDPYVSPIVRPKQKRKIFAEHRYGPMFAKYDGRSVFNRRKVG